MIATIFRVIFSPRSLVQEKIPEKKPYELVAIIFIPIFVYFLLFSYALNTPFMTHDEYRFFQPLAGLDWPHCCAGEVVADHYRFNGRFLAAEIMRLFNYLPVKTITDLSWVRLFVVLCLSFSVSLFVVILRLFHVDFWFSILSALAIFSVPGFSVGVTWLMATPAVVGCLPGLLAFLALFKAHETGRNRFSFLCCFLLFTSFQIYPASTPVFFLPLFFVALFDNNFVIKFRTIIINSLVIYMTILVLYFLSHVTLMAFLNHFLELKWFSPNNLSFSLTDDLINKVLYFIMSITPHAISVWFIKGTSGFLLVSIILGSGLSVRIISSYLGGTWRVKRTLLTALVLVILVFLSNIQNILPSASFFQHRSISVYESMVVAALIWSISVLILNFISLWGRISDSLKGLDHRIIASIIILVFGLLMQSKNINHNVNLSFLEYRYLQAKITEHIMDGNTLENIFISSVITQETDNKELTYSDIEKQQPPEDVLNYLGEKILIGGAEMQYPEYGYAAFREEWPAYVISILRELQPNMKITDVCDANHQPERCSVAKIKVAYNGRIGGNSVLSKEIFEDTNSLYVDMRNLKYFSENNRLANYFSKIASISEALDSKSENLSFDGVDFTFINSPEFNDLNYRLVVNGYKNTKYNIIKFTGNFYAIHQTDGAFDIQRFNSQAYKEEIFTAKDIYELFKTLDKI